jgi:hypothetical protein
MPLDEHRQNRCCLVSHLRRGQTDLEWAHGRCLQSSASNLPRGLGIHGTLRPAREFHASGGHDDWLLPAYAPGGVQPPG